jgi:Skp family chaperone for outer membrane proteins
MRKILSRALVLTGLMAIASVGPPAAAQELPTATIAVIDTQKILREATAWQDARKQIDGYRDKFQGEIAKDEESLRNQQQELTRQRPVLSPSAFEEKRQEFQREVAEVQRKAQDRRRALERISNSVRSEIGQSVKKIVSELAQVKRFNIVLDRGQVLFRADSVEITAQILAELNKRLPSIKVPAPQIK